MREVSPYSPASCTVFRDHSIVLETCNQFGTQCGPPYERLSETLSSRTARMTAWSPAQLLLNSTTNHVTSALQAP